MVTANTLIEERERFLRELRFNKTRLVDFLGAMAPHYKQPLARQIGIFFHAPVEGKSYAEERLWTRLKSEVKDGAAGVPVLADDGKSTLYLYDLADTENAARPELQSLVWHYDEAKDGAAVRALLASECWKISIARPLRYSIRSPRRCANGRGRKCAMLTEVEWNILMKDLWQGKKSLTEEEEKMFPQAMEKVLAMKEAYWMGTGELTEAETLQWEKLQEEIDRQSEEAEKKHEALVEKALQTRESPQVEGRWAQIRRGFLQWYSPEEWLNLVESGEAAMYLKRIEEETEKRYQRMYRHEEETQILGRSLSRLEEIQTSNEIEAMLRELLTAELSR